MYRKNTTHNPFKYLSNRYRVEKRGQTILVLSNKTGKVVGTLVAGSLIVNKYAKEKPQQILEQVLEVA